MKKQWISACVLGFHAYAQATTYNVTNQTDFDNALTASASSVTNNTINVDAPGGVSVDLPETFPGNPPFSLAVNINDITPSFIVSAPLTLQTNSVTTLNSSNMIMTVNNVLTQSGGTLTANGNSKVVIGNTGSYALNGGTFQLGGNNPLSGAFSMGGGTLQVINSDLTLDLNMSLTLNTLSVLDTNGFNATLSGTVTSPAGSTPVFQKIGNGNLTLSNYNFSGNGEQHVNAGDLFVLGNCTIHYLSLGSPSGPSVVATFSDPAMSLTMRKTTSGGEAAAFQIGDFSTNAVVNQSAGTVSLLGAALNVSNQSGLGIYNLSGGSIYVTSDPNFPSFRAFLTLGRNTGSHPPTNGVLNLSGTGLIDVSSPTSLNALILGSLVGATASSTGQLNQTGGTIRIHDGGEFYLSGFGNGVYNFTGGFLEIGGSGSLLTGFGGGTGSYQFNFGGGTIQVIQSDFITNVNMTLLPNSTSTVDTNGFNATLSGQLTSSGALQKINAGTLTLSGANSYSGGTLLGGGTILLANNTGLGSGQLAMSDGTILSLNPTIAASNPIILAGSDTINVGSGTATLSGIISGQGSLVKSGSGILDLSGPNTYTGGSTINSGTLAIVGPGSLSPVGSVHVNGATFDISGMGAPSLTIGDLLGTPGSTVVLGSNNLTAGTSNDTTYAGSITGVGGSFTKTGSGSLLLSGFNTYSGPTTVSQGTLIVNGTIANSVTTVDAGAVLKGSGTLFDVIVYGTLEPGNGIGTITGNSFHFMSGSNLVNEINASGQTDLIVGTTSVTIDPGTTLDVSLDPGNYSKGQTYLFIESPSVSGKFTDVTSNYPRFSPEVQYFTDHVQLVLNTNDFVSLLPPNATQNEINVARYLDQLDRAGAVVPGSDLAFVFSVLSFATPEQLAHGLNTFHPAPYNSLLVAQEYTVLRYSSALFDRLNEMCGCYCRDRYNLWATPFGSYTHQQSPHNQTGYRGSTGGIALGLDRFVGNNLCVGLTGGYSNTHVNWKNPIGSGTVQTGYAGVYGRYFYNRFYLDTNVFAGFLQNNGKRKVFATSVAGTVDRTARSRFSGYSFNGYVGFGAQIYDLPFNLDLVGSLDWVGMYQNAFNENGALSLNLHVNGKEANLLRSQLGFILGKCLCNWVPEFGLSVAYDARFNGAKFVSNFEGYEGNFVTYGLSPSRFLVLPEVKITSCIIENRLSLSASYKSEVGDKYYDHTGMLSIKYSF